MAKGMFTQGAVVLTEQPLGADAVSAALRPFRVVKQVAAEGKPGWTGGHATWLIEMRPEVNAYVVVDALDVPWPDAMGDAKAVDGEDAMGSQALFGAWTLGFMGPHTAPGNLARAQEFASLYHQAEAAEAAERHRAFVRVRSSYVLGAEENAPMLPSDYDPRRELLFVTWICRAIARTHGALCYFNPGGETLFTPAGLEGMLDTCERAKLPPLPAWCGQRHVRLHEHSGWSVADTVGMDQLLVPDHEAVFETERFEAGQILNFVRSTSHFVTDKGQMIKTGHTTDGPGGRWKAVEAEQALMSPTRPVIRWYADAGRHPPSKLIRRSKRAHIPPPMPVPTATSSAQARGIGDKLKSLFGK